MQSHRTGSGAIGGRLATCAESDDALEACAWNPSNAAARGAPVELLATSEASFSVSGIGERATQAAQS